MCYKVTLEVMMTDIVVVTFSLKKGGFQHFSPFVQHHSKVWGCHVGLQYWGEKQDLFSAINFNNKSNITNTLEHWTETEACRRKQTILYSNKNETKPTENENHTQVNWDKQGTSGDYVMQTYLEIKETQKRKKWETLRTKLKVHRKLNWNNTTHYRGW